MRNFFRHAWKKLVYQNLQKGSSALGLAMLLGIVGVSSVYFAGQGDKTDQLREELGRDRHSLEARRINLSNFALAKSLVSYRVTGSGTSQRLESALFPQDYFNPEQWQMRLNQPFQNRTNTWLWRDAEQSLMIATAQEQGITDNQLNQLLQSQVRLMQLSNGSTNTDKRAISKLRFGQVHFDDPDKPYLATAIEVESTVELNDQKGRKIRTTERAKIPLDKPLALSPRLVITATGGAQLDSSVGGNGPGTSPSQPFESGRVRFSLFGSGVVASGKIYWASDDVASVDDCINAVGRCREEIFDEESHPEFWNQRQRNILAENQLIGSSIGDFGRQNAVLKRDEEKGKAKGNGETCTVEAEDGDAESDPFSWYRPQIAARQYTAFGMICSPDEDECRTVRVAFWMKDPPATEVTWQEVKAICSEPSERPECVMGDASNGNSFELAAYNRGLGRNGRYPLGFSPDHWAVWTDKMGVKNIKICIDASQNLRPVAQNCPARIGSTSDGCWKDNYPDNWEQNGIYYVNPKTCEAEFLFNRTACGCFSDDTKILMADQSWKVISDIVHGDRVWNPITKRSVAIKRMVRGPEKFPMVHIEIADSLIKVTGNHPFPTPDGIKAAHHLDEGDIVFDHDGREQKITSVDFVHTDEPPVVWNLELDGQGDDDDHFLIADGIVTGDLKIQQKLENAQRKLAVQHQP
ncbi:MAG: Hint domain-containing protein [Oligoflexus sp.]